MQNNDHLSKLVKIFKDIFPNYTGTINRETSSKNVNGWDSLTHVTFILEVEKAFNVMLRASEIADLENVGDLLDLLQRKAA